ncbi:adenylosuccinate synthetase [Variovorax sp. VNK109]|uniref:adenylosuccinate synthetase n=1 Tax=Variovorax sp. VNK109 TaxID=3400919 RepID=UPI003BFCAAF7
MTTRYTSLLGLGFGDCGKGLFTDYVCRAQRGHTVVRFNGGAQAGHNVVLPDGRHHTFSQFGAGSFMDGVATVLSAPFIIHPHALLFEAEALAAKGVPDILDRLLIDGRCRVTTPLHQAAGRLREWARASGASGPHGSCGVGVGETVLQELSDPQTAIRYADLTQRKRTLDKLAMLRERLRADAGLQWPGMASNAAAQTEWKVLNDESIGSRWLDAIQPCLRAAPSASPELLAQRLTMPGAVVFEGAQGVLLDERHGFHPHTTWSSISTDAVESVLLDLGLHAEVTHLGVMRSYLTRHGAGPLPTQDAALDVLAEPHNSNEGWQGAFRRGHPDSVLLEYAVSAVGRLDGIVATHLDVFDRFGPLQWCIGYGHEPGGLTDHLPLGTPGDVAHAERIMELLDMARPVYAATPLRNASSWCAAVEAVAGVPVTHTASGPLHVNVDVRRPFAKLE